MTPLLNYHISESLAGKRRKRRPFSLVEVDMTKELVPLEPLNGNRQPIGVPVHVGGVDLVSVSEEDHLCPLTGSSDDGLQLMDGEVLALINNDKALGEASPSDV